MPDAITLRGETPGVQPPDRSLNLKDAAGKFEALLIAQMLKSAREPIRAAGGEADQSSSAILDMAEQHLAELLGSQGSLGLARMVVKQIGEGPRGRPTTTAECRCRIGS